MNARSLILKASLISALTPLKILSAAIYPLIAIFSLRKTNRADAALFACFMAMALLAFSLSEEHLLINSALSIILLSTFIIFSIFSESISKSISHRSIENSLNLFFHIALINGIIGSFQFILSPGDDSAIGFYGRSGLQTHGLAIIYFLSLIYFLSKGATTPNKTKALASAIFFVTCTYGIGLITLIISLGVAAVLNGKSRTKSILTAIAMASLAYLALKITNPRAVEYNTNSITLFFHGLISIINDQTLLDPATPRKLIAWLSYFSLIHEDPIKIITGVGPGTFNSRAAFILNGDYSSLKFIPTSYSIIHFQTIMPLWSSEILSKAYQDGSMNQPFSSVLAILAEYGLLAIAIIAYSLSKLRNKACKSAAENNKEKIFYINASFIFILLIGVFDNIYEYPEIVLPFFLLIIWLSKSNEIQKRSNK